MEETGYKNDCMNSPFLNGSFTLQMCFFLVKNSTVMVAGYL